MNKMSAYLPVFVMIISVPNSLNFSHNSLVSSLHFTRGRHSEFETWQRTGVTGLSVRTGENTLVSLGEAKSSWTESVSRTESDSESLTDNMKKIKIFLRIHLKNTVGNKWKILYITHKQVLSDVNNFRQIS